MGLWAHLWTVKGELNPKPQNPKTLSQVCEMKPVSKQLYRVLPALRALPNTLRHPKAKLLGGTLGSFNLSLYGSYREVPIHKYHLRAPKLQPRSSQNLGRKLNEFRGVCPKHVDPTSKFSTHKPWTIELCTPEPCCFKCLLS